jgi:DNA-binding FrmR family transcriptional regulator
MDIAKIIEGVGDLLLPKIAELASRMDRIEGRLDGMSERLDMLSDRISDIYNQLGNINQRIDRLYEVIVRREEHMLLADRVRRLEEDMSLIKEKVAA